MSTITEIKKEFNVKFPKATVKIETRDGTYRPLRNHDNKTYRLIPTYVTLSPMDCTDVKANKIQDKIDEIISYFKSKGGVVQSQTRSFAIINFLKPKKNATDEDKGYQVTITRESFRSTMIYDAMYQQVFIDVTFEKI
jgi:hypothetical protein